MRYRLEKIMTRDGKIGNYISNCLGEIISLEMNKPLIFSTHENSPYIITAPVRGIGQCGTTLVVRTSGGIYRFCIVKGGKDFHKSCYDSW